MTNLAHKETTTPEISLREYQEWTANTAAYPQSNTGRIEELMYLSLGMSGEAGEVSNCIKKLFRDQDTPELRANLSKELGDVMWYAARLATALDVDLTEIISMNKAKLEDRMARGVIKGSGDNR